VLIALSWLVAAACGGDSSGGGPAYGEGVVQAVDAAQNQVTIKHGDIPGVMDAMTMSFDVDDPTLLQGLEPGAEVRFGVRYVDGRYLVSSIERKPAP
jgi:Cu/Ag efflux protein CusF